MLDQIMDIVRQQGQQTVVANPAVPDEQNEAVMQEAAATVANGVQQKFQQSGPAGVQQLLEGAQSGNPAHPEVQGLSSQFVNNITQKFGIPAGAAQSIGASLIPMVLSMFSNKATSGDGKGFDIGSIIGALTGGGGSGHGGGGLLGSLGSKLDTNKDGKTDLNDLKGLFGK